MDNEQTVWTESILFVDDDPNIISSLRRFARSQPYKSYFAGSGDEALSLMEEHFIDVIVSDMKMPKMSGDELLREVSQRYPETIRIVLSGFSEEQLIISAINEGRIWGFIQKPWNVNELIQTIDHALYTQQIVAERAILKKTLNQYEQQKKEQFQGFVGSSIAMQFIYKAIEKAAQSSASVMITGESGTGKEVTARALHDLSKRKDEPFIALNCAAIPGELMESEIFGHIKGAFSGAVSNRDGAATQANGGTLFLDELAEMDINLQSKLLRFIQTGTFQRVGGNRLEEVDIRFICATNRDPITAINDKKLREDLYYRLNVIPINLPPLRERENDACVLANTFLTKFADKEDKVVIGFSSDAEKLLKAYHWPGNVRQLENAVHNAVVMSDGPLITDKCLSNALGIQRDSLKIEKTEHQAAFADTTNHVSVAVESNISTNNDSIEQIFEGEIVPLAKIEEQAIKHAIDKCDGNVVRAAGLLQVSPSTLYRKIQSWETE